MTSGLCAVYRKLAFSEKLRVFLGSWNRPEFQNLCSISSRQIYGSYCTRRGLRKKWAKNRRFYLNVSHLVPLNISSDRNWKCSYSRMVVKTQHLSRGRFQVTRKYTRALVRYANIIILISYSRLIRVTVQELYTTVGSCIFPLFFLHFFLHF